MKWALCMRWAIRFPDGLYYSGKYAKPVKWSRRLASTYVDRDDAELVLMVAGREGVVVPIDETFVGWRPLR